MTTIRTSILTIAVGLTLAGCATTVDQEAGEQSRVRVVPASDVEWGPLNPLRGDKSPKAGTLWGDRAGPVPSGFLVRFVDGFASPPHIHPVTYRGVVVSGLVHNAVPEAAETWLPPGSFWTQPAGEVHITAAKGRENVAYIEIEKGPYLVHPETQAFDNGEAPIQLAASSMAWVDPPGVPPSARGPKVATLPGNPHDDQLRRTLVRLPPGFDGSVRSHDSALHAVVILGRLVHEVRGETDTTTLEPGSYFGSEGATAHRISSDATEGCVLYVRTAGGLDIALSQSGQ